MIVCLSGHLHEGRKVGVPYFRDLASRPGVGIGNTLYQVKPDVEQTGQINPNTTTAVI